MKKLRITKEQFNRSRYFQKKYGKLEYVSESGKLFKTNKGKVLKFKESSKKFGKKFKESVAQKWAVFVDDGIDEIFDSRDEAKRYASSVRDDSDSYNRRTRAYVKKLSRSEIEEMFGESVGDVSKDPAYVCPYCGSRNCVFDDADDSPLEGYFDGGILTALFYCNDCDKFYNVAYELNVKDVYPNEDADEFGYEDELGYDK